jgi:hypothetical protein
MTGTELSARELDALEAEIDLMLGTGTVPIEKRREIELRVAAIREKVGLSPLVVEGTPRPVPSAPSLVATAPIGLELNTSR